MTFEGIDVFEIDEEDGRIATLWAYWDARPSSRSSRGTRKGGRIVPSE